MTRRFWPPLPGASREEFELPPFINVYVEEARSGRCASGEDTAIDDGGGGGEFLICDNTDGGGGGAGAEEGGRGGAAAGETGGES